MFDLSTPIARVRTVGRIEGVSFLLLLCVAMPLDRLAGIHLAVKIGGWTHGILFILLAMVTFQAWIDKHLSFKQSCMVAVAAVLPFGPFIIDRRLLQAVQTEAAPHADAGSDDASST